MTTDSSVEDRSTEGVPAVPDRITIPWRGRNLVLSASPEASDLMGRLTLVDSDAKISLSLPQDLFDQMAEIGDVVMVVDNGYEPDFSALTYPPDLPRCIMCGAERGKPCLVISTAHNEFYNQTAGEIRETPHYARGKAGEPDPVGIAVKDEPDFSDS